MVYHHPNKFCDNRHCNVRDLITSICQVISRDHVLEGPCDIMDGNVFPCFVVRRHPVKIGDHKDSGSEDIFLICHVKEQRDFTSKSSSR